MLLLIALACSDYELTEDVDVAAGDAPQLAIDPGVVGGAACDLYEESVLLENTGGGDLEITAMRATGDWQVEAFALPLTLPPGETLRVLVWGPIDSEGLLKVDSNDPDDPVLTVPLSAWADEGPSVSLLSPADGAILDPTLPVALKAEVSDDIDGELSVSWVSDVDGLIASEISQGGVASGTWATGRSPGDHQLSAYVTDSCGNEAEARAWVCANEGYTEDELDISTWHFEGAASWDSTNTVVVLTEALQNQVGTAFQTSQQVDGSAVTIRFSFYQGEGTGADGISLTALDTTRMTTFLGGTGCGIGYGGDASCTDGPALPGWSIEVDTYYNEGQDPTPDDHVMFTFDGDVDDPAAWAALPEMEDSGWHTMEVEVQAPHVRVTIDGTAYIDQDLSGHFGFPAYVGFTAGTGGQTNRHLIDSLEVSGQVCE